MEETFGITYEIKNPVPWQPNRTIRTKEGGYTSMHNAKATAGREIHKPFIKSVCAYQRTGNGAGSVGLWLDKDSQGHIVTREVN